MRYIGLLDGHPGAYGVVFPDAPGCAAMSATIEETLRNAADALAEWMDDTRTANLSVPAARTVEKVRADPEVAEALAEGAALVVVPLLREPAKSARANRPGR